MRWALVIWLLVCAACSGDATQVLVRIDAQPASRARARRVRVKVITTEGMVITHDVAASGMSLGYPLILPLAPNGDPSTRTWTVEAELLDASNTPFAWARLRGRYVAGQIREALLCFTDLCSDTQCDPCSAVSDGGPVGACTTCDATRACTPVAEATLDVQGTAELCPPVVCTAMGTTETNCGEADPNDDDCDDQYNCLDSDCEGASCGLNGRLCRSGTCTCPAGEGEDTLALCHDGVDNDCDGRTDCADDDPCRTFVEDCSTPQDDDCDGVVGCGDSDCGVPENCSTPEDEDCDGEVCDVDCARSEDDPTFCHDGVDNDCDGWVDCDDEGCCLNGNCNGQIIGERGGISSRCCAGTPTDVFSNVNHCGACGVSCAAGRMCVMVGGVGAACRCGPAGDDSTCPAGFQCRDLEGQIVCDCDGGNDCGFYNDCRTRGGAMFHNLCGPLQ